MTTDEYIASQSEGHADGKNFILKYVFPKWILFEK